MYITATPPLSPPHDGTTTPSMPRAPEALPRPLPAPRRLGARARGGSRPSRVGERRLGGACRRRRRPAVLCSPAAERRQSVRRRSARRCGPPAASGSRGRLSRLLPLSCGKSRVCCGAARLRAALRPEGAARGLSPFPALCSGRPAAAPLAFLFCFVCVVVFSFPL